MSLVALLVHRKGQDIGESTYSVCTYMRRASAIRLHGIRLLVGRGLDQPVVGGVTRRGGA
jgi:hypothetical protein